MAANRRQMMAQRNPVARQQCSPANAGQLQQLRLTPGAGGKNDFPLGVKAAQRAALTPQHAMGALLAIEQNLCDLRLGLDLQTTAPQGWMQVRNRSGIALAVADTGFVDAGAFKMRAVEIFIERVTRLLAGLQISLAHRMRALLHRRDAHRAVAAMPGGFTEWMRFHLFEIRQHLAITPT